MEKFMAGKEIKGKDEQKIIEDVKPKGNFIKKMLSFFNIATTRRGVSSAEIPSPAERQKKSFDRPKAVKLPTNVYKLWQWWLSETADSTQTLKDRMERYKDLSYMYYNNTVISMAIELYADETVQADAQAVVLQIFARKAKVKKYIEEFFEKIGITQNVLRNTAFDLALFGDAVWINITDSTNGITEIIPQDVMSLTERFEFNAVEYEKQIGDQRKRLYKNLYNRDQRLQNLAAIYNQNAKDDMSIHFRKHLFGYQFGEKIYLAPWNVTHFRRFSTQSEFYPYGRPLLINSIAPFRQLQASKNLMAMARVAKFPKEHYQVKTDDGMTAVEKWSATNEAREEYHNLGTEQTGKEDFGIGGQVWTPDDLIKFDLLENRMNIEDINDVEMLRDDMILGTRVPKGYLIVERASFGTSGQALLQQFKPFGRAVYTVQSCILQELIQLVKLQFAMTGDHPIDEPFEITMNFPVIEESSDRLRVKSDTIRLANDVITNITSALGLQRGEALPPEVVKDVFSKISFLDVEDVERWINQAKPQEPTQEEKVKIQEKIEKGLNDTLIRESYFLARKQSRFYEGINNKRHFMSSFQVSEQQGAILRVLHEDCEEKKHKLEEAEKKVDVVEDK
jgi:hypothetical protein